MRYVIVLVLLLSIGGCEKDNAELILGLWTIDKTEMNGESIAYPSGNISSYTLEIFANGTMQFEIRYKDKTYLREDYNWEIDMGGNVLSFKGGEYRLSVTNDKLTLDGGFENDEGTWVKETIYATR